MIMERIVNSLLDTDLYTFTVGNLIFKSFSNTSVEYRFINRGKTSFPPNFASELHYQLYLMTQLKLTKEETDYLTLLGYFEKDYIQFLKDYRFNPSQLFINCINGELVISIHGPWVETIMWEVPLLALISELYYKLTGATPDIEWKDRLTNKARNLSDSQSLWIDFGTRRRFSLAVQNEVVNTMKNFPGFMGTSNCLLAMKHGVKTNGTMSHQLMMGMMAKYGVVGANKMARHHWREVYDDKLLIFLPDTFSTDVFLRDFQKEEAENWAGLRQDSGMPDEWMDKVLSFYDKLEIRTKFKTFIFSDSLTDEKYIKLSLKYRKFARIIGGIGTFLSNDCGHKPLSIVIKLASANFGDGMRQVVKLSDDPAKNTGNNKFVDDIKRQLKIA